MEILRSLIADIGLALVRLIEKLVPAAAWLEDHASTIGWVFLVVFGVLILASITGLRAR